MQSYISMEITDSGGDGCTYTYLVDAQKLDPELRAYLEKNKFFITSTKKFPYPQHSIWKILTGESPAVCHDAKQPYIITHTCGVIFEL